MLDLIALVMCLISIVMLVHDRPQESIAASGLSSWCSRQARRRARLHAD